jgi:alpha-glucosidase
VFKDQYLELSSVIAEDANIYGLGERVHALRLDPTGKTYTMFAADAGTPVDTNLYASHPFYMELRKGVAHGVFMKVV